MKRRILWASLSICIAIAGCSGNSETTSQSSVPPVKPEQMESPSPEASATPVESPTGSASGQSFPVKEVAGIYRCKTRDGKDSDPISLDEDGNYISKGLTGKYTRSSETTITFTTGELTNKYESPSSYDSATNTWTITAFGSDRTLDATCIRSTSTTQ